jgi:hypothetical protein
LAERESSALASLPHALVLHILSLLPVDTRLRCAEVCRGWRAVLRDPGLWRRLDLTASGVSPNREPTDALLHAAAARAGGQLGALDVSCCDAITREALLAAVTANGGTLRELRVCGLQGRFGEYTYNERLDKLNTAALETLLRAAPRLDVCEADVTCTELTLARRMLRNEPPLSPLHVRTFAFHGEPAVLDEAAVVALAADLASHAHLRLLRLRHAPLNTAAALDAVVDAALSRRLTSVALGWCSLSPASAPALVRLISGGALAQLDIGGNADALLDAPAALVLGNALRASSTITAVSMRYVNLWGEPAIATALLGALTGHPSLHSLNVSYNQVDPPDREEAGAALGALVAANAPALTELDVSWCDLRDAGLGPLFDALPANTHLRKLNCTVSNPSDAFVRDTLLPAVRANASLHKLTAWQNSNDAREAEALVQRRADAE